MDLPMQIRTRSLGSSVGGDSGSIGFKNRRTSFSMAFFPTTVSSPVGTPASSTGFTWPSPYAIRTAVMCSFPTCIIMLKMLKQPRMEAMKDKAFVSRCSSSVYLSLHMREHCNESPSPPPKSDHV